MDTKERTEQKKKNSSWSKEIHNSVFQGGATTLVEPLHGAHGGLDMEGAYVLPVLLQQRNQEVHGQMHVLDLSNSRNKIIFYQKLTTIKSL
jgi:hypothetical protein